jgi:hypothetical membrane protein
MQESVPLASSKPSWNQTARWLVFIGGVVNPVAFVVVYTVEGLLRPGYSPVHQAISDLGVGPNGSLHDAIAVVHGLLLIAFAIGFALIMRQVLTTGWLVFSAAFLVLRGLSGITAAIFTEAPETVAIHSLAAFVSLVSTVGAFTVIGTALGRDRKWRGWGTYSIAAALLTLVLAAVMFWIFTPGTLLAPARLGGLMERVVSVETLAWYVAFGWRLFIFAGQAPNRAREAAAATLAENRMTGQREL